MWALIGIVAATAMLLLTEPLGASSLAFGRTATVVLLATVDVLLTGSVWVVVRGRRVSTSVRRGVGLALTPAAVLVASTAVGLLLAGSGAAVPLVALAAAGPGLVSRHLLRHDDA